MGVSLLCVLQDDEIDRIHETLVQEYGAMNYKAFTSLLVEITQDTSSMEQLSDAFREMAKEKVSSLISHFLSRAAD